MTGRISAPPVVIGGLVGASLLVFWLSDRLPQVWLSPLAVLLLGCGLGASAWFNLRSRPLGLQDGLRGFGLLRALWQLGQDIFLLGLGWWMAFAGGAALLLGWDDVLETFFGHPGLLILAAGIVLAGVGMGHLLALDEQPARGWQAVLRFPLRLAGLPALVLGIGLMALGTLQILAPDRVAAWIRSLASG